MFVKLSELLSPYCNSAWHILLWWFNRNVNLYWRIGKCWSQIKTQSPQLYTGRICKGLDFDDYFEFCRGKKTRANHPYKIQTKLAKVNSLEYSFFVRIAKDWNSLSKHLFTDEISANKLKKGLKRWMKIYWHRSSYFNCIYFHFKYHSYCTILYLH